MNEQRTYEAPSVKRGVTVPEWAKNVVELLREEAQSGQTRQVKPVYVTVVNSDRRYVQVSESFCQLVGYTREELIGRRYDDLTAQNTTDIATVYFLFARLGYMHGLWTLIDRNGARILVRYESWTRSDSYIESNMELVGGDGSSNLSPSF
jgi:PAS domain S-box-containing protein